ncbi:hypothetical protein GCM10011416_04330 [Polaribacter pacificus]|uniref:DUF6089 domain-containing protein n=1 Tax=Polaribacter pacificus TaxID=1775173 RepID=A0A917HUB6_9FLAO|nr:DUF6089 family protein [Polaribacter pacificus]GGG90934.1 hypothetical protein GCM10011416_04330 [Polaribacter pacificus]
MRKQFLILVCVCITSISWSQVHEIGMSFGGVNYIGDVGKTTYLSPNAFGGGIFYKYNLNPRVALRGGISYYSIEADDADATNGIRKNRGYSFNNAINELAIGVEFNFFEYNIASTTKTYTPYILLELAGIMYKSPKTDLGNGQFAYQNKKAISIPFGIGFKSKLTQRIALAIESKVSYTFKDDLDYTSKDFPSLNFGGNSNDWYVFTGISLVYTFGRPACFAEFR